MSRVITFSRVFPSYHPRKGEPTFFVEKIWQSIDEDFSKTIIGLDKELIEYVNIFHYPKYHTIRAGNRWKVGDKFSPRVWSDKPYASKQIIIAPDIEVKSVQSFQITPTGNLCSVYIDETLKPFEILNEVSKNDGLSREDFNYWFSSKKVRDNGFKGQIICWNEKIKY